MKDSSFSFNIFVPSGERKENKDPKKTDKVPNDTKLSPSRSNQCNSLKVPSQTLNGSSQQTLTIDVECPLNQVRLIYFPLFVLLFKKEIFGYNQSFGVVFCFVLVQNLQHFGNISCITENVHS